MRFFKTLLWLVIFIGITILFNYRYEMNFTLAGMMDEVTDENVITSIIFLGAWIILAFISGFMNYRSVYMAAIIYSILPFIGLVGGVFLGTPLANAILIPFYLAVPVQGLNFFLVFLLLPSFYIIFKVCDKIAYRHRIQRLIGRI